MPALALGVVGLSILFVASVQFKDALGTAGRKDYNIINTCILYSSLIMMQDKPLVSTNK